MTQEGKESRARSQEAWALRESLPVSEPVSSTSKEDAGQRARAAFLGLHQMPVHKTWQGLFSSALQFFPAVRKDSLCSGDNEGLLDFSDGLGVVHFLL